MPLPRVPALVLLLLLGCDSIFSFHPDPGDGGDAPLPDLAATDHDGGGPEASPPEDVNTIDLPQSCTDLADGASCQLVPNEACDSCVCCGGTCVYVLTDAANCGSCGHSCDGGECQNGQCRRVEVHTNYYLSDIAIDSQHIYVTQTLTGTIYRIDRSGANPVDLDVTNEALAVAVDATDVFWGNQTELYKLPKGGFSVAIGSAPATGILLTSTHVVHARSNNLWSTPKVDAGTSTPITGSLANGRFAVDDDAIYFREGTSILSSVSDGSEAPTVLFQAQDNNGGMAVDGQTLFWSNIAQQELRQGAITGGASFPLPTSACANLLEVDASYVYWSSCPNEDPTTVKRVSRAGGNPEILWFGDADDVVLELVGDDRSLFWLVYTDSTMDPEQIWKIAK